MNVDFLSRHGAVRTANYDAQWPLLDPPEDDQDPPDVVLDYEVDTSSWGPISVTTGASWRDTDWSERPVRFIDGSDRGRTVAWLRAPGGYPVPIRLGEIGAVAVRTDDGRCRRECADVERIVAMVVDPFPWDEIEAFATALPAHGLRLLPAMAPGGAPSHDFEEMRKAAQNRTMTEMGALEEAILARTEAVPTIVDGRLEPRAGGLMPGVPVAGVIKTHRLNYLHAAGLRTLYDLEPGQRTPIFALPEEKLPVASWFVRLTGANRSMPTWGTVRVEVPLALLRGYPDTVTRFLYVNRLSRLLCDYRSHSSTYARAAVSLEPIVRAEELLKALFTAPERLAAGFYRVANL
jgi:hypothetical protein